jgi:hypothetical protein
MSVKRATFALAVLCAAFGWSSSASALSWTVGGASCSLPGFCIGGTAVAPGVGYVDTYYAQVDAQSDSPAGAGFVSLAVSGGLLANVSYQWRYDLVPGSQDAGVLSSGGSIAFPGSQTNIPVDLDATSPDGGIYSYYELIIKYDATGTAGGGYTLTLGTTPCGVQNPCPVPPGVPVPPAAILFVSGLAGLGLLGRKRRKVAQA